MLILQFYNIGANSVLVSYTIVVIQIKLYELYFVKHLYENYWKVHHISLFFTSPTNLQKLRVQRTTLENILRQSD